MQFGTGPLNIFSHTGIRSAGPRGIRPRRPRRPRLRSQDMRLAEAEDLKVSEMALTGEAFHTAGYSQRGRRAGESITVLLRKPFWNFD